MRLLAWLLVCLALATGLLQSLICAVMLFSSGWAIPVVLMLMLLPFLALILMQEIAGWRRLNPMVPAAVALCSIAVSCGFYWELFTRMNR
jgi:ABC-type nickel/cobalt efflux system permease component RcnA